MLLCSVCFWGCSQGTKYHLTSVSGLSGVSAMSYEYNYIELKDNGTYYLENKAKANGIVTKQSGKYLILDNGSMILSESDNGNNYLLASGETIYCINGQITVSGYISGIGQVRFQYQI